MSIVCNVCGKNIPAVDGICREDYIHIKKEWGYFSNKDGVSWEFNICESCADKIKNKMLIPCVETETKEFL